MVLTYQQLVIAIIIATAITILTTILIITITTNILKIYYIERDNLRVLIDIYIYIKHYSTYSVADYKNTDKVKEFIKSKNLKPVYIYDSVQENYTRWLILSDTSNISGIYLILNKTTLHYYIG